MTQFLRCTTTESQQDDPCQLTTPRPSADDLDNPGDLHICHDLASADDRQKRSDLGSQGNLATHYNQTASHPEQLNPQSG